MSEKLLVADVREKIHKLLDSVEAGDSEMAGDIIRELNAVREDSLYRKVGELTRALHDSLKNFNDGDQVLKIAGVDLPDARARLIYVIEKTKQAADKTMDKIEVTVPISDRLKTESSELLEKWEKISRREMSGAEFREVFKTMLKYLKDTQSKSETIHANLSEILLAQDFQDLTGQVLTRVIRLVTDLEDSLVNLIKLAGDRGGGLTTAETVTLMSVSEKGPEGPQIDSSKKGVVSGQDEVDALLSSLGF